MKKAGDVGVLRTATDRIYRQNFNTISCYDDKGNFLFTMRFPTEEESTQVMIDLLGECEVVSTYYTT